MSATIESAAPRTAAPTAEETRAIAREAYVYGFPLVDNYRIAHAYFVDTANPEYKGPWNQWRSFARLMTPEDKAVQTPNSDTAYSFLGLDLRAEPIVVTVPRVEDGRYFVLQFVDFYTFNFAYVGTRSTGNGGGNFLVAGPGWNGDVPEGIEDVIRSETELLLVPTRTQLFDAGDIDNVKVVQAGYGARPLSAFLGQPAPPPAPRIDFIAPLSPAEQRSSLRFFEILNFVLRFCPPHPSERELLARFAKIGIGAGLPFDPDQLEPETREALAQGMADGWKDLEAADARMGAGEITSGDIFGTREHLQNNYLYRMLGAAWAIYGNSQEEAIYPNYAVDADGEALDGSKGNYTMRLAPDRMPPVSAFWSLTMYEMPASYLYPNPLERYLLNAPMLPQFVRDADGGLTFHIQNESPGPEREPNWLPAPAGPFKLVMRLYGPQPAAFDGTWQPPKLERAA